MPRRLPRPCTICGRLTNGSRCPAHRPPARKKPTNPLYNRAWRKVSQDARKAQPWCSTCGSTQDLTVDHIAPGSLDAGIRVLCRPCNSRKNNR